MHFTAIVILAVGLAADLAAARPTAAYTKDPMPIDDLLWECKAPAQIEFDDCEPVREMIMDKGDEDGYYTPETEECEAFESGNCRLTLCPEINPIIYYMPDIATTQIHFVAAMCALSGYRGWISPTNGTYNLWLSESGWTGHD